jgi:hypothetical protein
MARRLPGRFRFSDVVGSIGPAGPSLDAAAEI